MDIYRDGLGWSGRAGVLSDMKSLFWPGSRDASFLDNMRLGFEIQAFGADNSRVLIQGYGGSVLAGYSIPIGVIRIVPELLVGYVYGNIADSNTPVIDQSGFYLSLRAGLDFPVFGNFRMGMAGGYRMALYRGLLSNVPGQLFNPYADVRLSYTFGAGESAVAVTPEQSVRPVVQKDQTDTGPLVLQNALRLTLSRTVFTPTPDKPGEKLEIQLYADNRLSGWKLQVFRKGSVIPFWETNGNQSGDYRILWNGLNATGDEILESLEEYTVVLSGLSTNAYSAAPVSKVFNTGVLMESHPEGLRIRTSRIMFTPGSANLTPESYKILDQVIRILKEMIREQKGRGNTTFSIEISGYTDDVGEEAVNLRLSAERAQSVYNYLVYNEIPPELLSYKGYGETRLYRGYTEKQIQGLPSNEQEYYRSRSRRVEFLLRGVLK